MPRFLGDCVNCTASIELLRMYYPGATFYLVIQDYLRPLFELDDDIKCIVDNRKNGKLKGTHLLVKVLKEVEADIAILFTNKLVDALIAKLARIPRRIGYDTEMRSALLTDSLKFDKCRHYINRYAYLANRACNDNLSKLPSVKLNFDSSLSNIGENHLAIGFSILSPEKTSRHFPVESTIATIELMQKKLNVPFDIYMFGSASEHREAEKVTQQVSLSKSCNIHNLAGQRSIPELISDIAAVDVLVTADSGPLHIASATQTSTVALHTKGTSAFSMVCPKGQHVVTVNSRGGFIRDNDQVIDLLPEDVVNALTSIIESKISLHQVNNISSIG